MHTQGARHVFVYREAGRFAGWPANNGIWSWGDEILVAFHVGEYRASEGAHSYNTDKPVYVALARSLDGGEMWKTDFVPQLDDETSEPKPCPGGIDFTHPEFAMKCRADRFWLSYDRGRSWDGPWRLPDFGRKLSARTDYIVNGSRECLFFLSAFEPKVEAGLQDRAFCAKTTDGGKTFEFLGWMAGEPLNVRSVMPSTVRVGEGRLVSTMRRRLDSRPEGKYKQENWIDAYGSNDDGATWTFLSKVADTGYWNGNPPSLIRLRDGRLCLAHGYREKGFGIRAKLSGDDGAIWSDEIILRDDGRNWDIGYCRTAQRPDGRLVTIYYFTTAANPEQHIAATIWRP